MHDILKVNPKDLTLSELTKALKECELHIRELPIEIEGKKSVLTGAYKDVKKGHPHYEQKCFIEEELKLDISRQTRYKVRVQQFRKEIDSRVSQLANAEK